MEVLSEILRSMRVRGSVYFCDNLVAPWTLEFDDTKAANFHLLRRGSCWLISGDRRECLEPGDLVFAEPGRDHALASHLPGQPPPEKTKTLLLCGYCEFLEETPAQLAEVFTSLCVVRAEDLAKRPWLKSTLDQLSAEYLAQQPGAELVVDKLTEILLVELIRLNFCRREQSSFVRALSDPQISRALTVIHDHPEKPWTLESIAAEAGMSRAALARRFKDLIGRGVFQYLTEHRMQKARELLKDPRLRLYAVANRVGYESDLAFTKVFKKHTGLTPTQYRKSLEG